MKAFLVGMGLALASLANAHPLGNNTVNRQAGLALSPTTLTVDYRVDIAEIPTLLATTDADTDGDGSTSKAEWARYARAYGERIQSGITLRADGAPLTLHLDAARAALAPGAAGLNTLLISARFSAPLQVQTGMKLTYQDQREADQSGWKEVYFHAASGLEVRVSDVPAASQSRNLTVYPAGDVPNVLAATVEMGVISLPQTVAPGKPESPAPDELVPTPPAVAPALARAPRPAPAVVATLDRPPALAPVVVPPPRPSSAVPSNTTSPAPRTLPVWAFFRLGAHHIAIGWDHLMFLLGLILAQFSVRPRDTAQFNVRPLNTAQFSLRPKPAAQLSSDETKAAQVTPSAPLPPRPRWRRLVGVVTAFTLAHSLTLGLAASGLIMLPGAWVEAAIALTIAYVGLMNLLGRTRHSTLLAFAFGLVHGFGFAGALAASMGSLRTQGHDWLLNLAAFNLGIEAFQLGLVLLLVPMLGWITRHAWSDKVLHTLSFFVMSAGLGWFLSRI